MDPWLPCATVGDCFRLDSSTCLIDCVPQVLISYRDRVLVVFFSISFIISFFSVDWFGAISPASTPCPAPSPRPAPSRSDFFVLNALLLFCFFPVAPRPRPRPPRPDHRHHHQTPANSGRNAECVFARVCAPCVWQLFRPVPPPSIPHPAAIPDLGAGHFTGLRRG